MSNPLDENKRLGEELLTESLRLLLKRVKDGSATAADLAVAERVVARMGIEMLPKKGNPAGQLAGALGHSVADDLPFPVQGASH